MLGVSNCIKEKETRAYEDTHRSKSNDIFHDWHSEASSGSFGIALVYISERKDEN